jgi:hypothetical protein
MFQVSFVAIALAALLSGCASATSSPDEAARQAQEQQDLQAGANTHVLAPGDHLGTASP